MKVYLYVITGVLAVFVLGNIYTMYSRDGVINDYATAFKTVADIKNDVAISHLWFEETIHGHEHATFDSFWKSMDKVDSQVELLQRLHLQSGVGFERMPGIVNNLKNYLESFRSIANQREKHSERGAIASILDRELDTEFDAEFNKILDACDKLDNALGLSRAQNLAPFRVITITLIVVGLLTVSGVLLSIWFSWKKRVHQG